MGSTKELNEIIKKAVQQDDNLKELYNSYTDEEKSAMKEKLIRDNELHNLITKHHVAPLDKLQEFAAMFLKEDILARGFKKHRGKKAKAYAFNKAFVYWIKDYTIGIKPVKYTKKGTEYCFYFLLEVPSDKGKIYVDFRESFINEGDDEDDFRLVLYTAHFFDRYKERLGLEGDRGEVVDQFIKDELTSMKSGSGMSSEGKRVTFNLAKGLALGEYSGKNLLLKTFISEKEINSYQEKMKQELVDMQDNQEIK